MGELLSAWQRFWCVDRKVILRGNGGVDGEWLNRKGPFHLCHINAGRWVGRKCVCLYVCRPADSLCEGSRKRKVPAGRSVLTRAPVNPVFSWFFIPYSSLCLRVGKKESVSGRGSAAAAEVGGLLRRWRNGLSGDQLTFSSSAKLWPQKKGETKIAQSWWAIWH